MSDYTVVRIDVDTDVIRRAARVVPGVEVPAEFDPDSKRVTPFPGGTDTSADEVDSAADGRQAGQIRSLVGEYGLLAAGVAMVGAGVATVALWWYRRRNSTDGQRPGDREQRPARGETPPPADLTASEGRHTSAERVRSPDDVPGEEVTGVDEISGTEPTEFDTAVGETATEARDAGVSAEDSNAAVAEHDESSESAPHQSADDSNATAGEPTDDERTAEAATGSDDELSLDSPSPPGENGSLDRAPLLGVAFVALSGAVVRWLQRES
ncbi:hypothetical protein [Haloarcula montana]|uniref:hypothetical protein n=1 Tax=Haloarcula montana TaxID=3111776 RepID=UPI002D799E85|nr:hypothetical protein [Haloarcula sp. GH36]